VTIDRFVIVLLAILWSVLWIGVSLLEQTPYLHAAGFPWWVIPALMLPSCLVTGAFFILWHVADGAAKIAPDRPKAWLYTALRLAPLLAIGEMVLVHGTRMALFAAGGLDYVHLPWPGLALYEFCKSILFFALWLGLAFGAKTFLAWQQQGRNLIAIQKNLAEAQLHQLRQQLQPHFLFNTLNTISSLMQTDVARADNLIARLADLLRSSLRLNEQTLVPLAGELHFLELYAGVMTERLGDRVRLHWQIAAEARDTLLPAMLLQPLLENAFRHGVEAVSGPQTVSIAASCTATMLTIVIQNSGAPLHHAPAEGIGLGNCRRRLHLHYGEKAGLLLAANPAGGATLTLSLPR
jgi:hypothetical protein